MKAGYTLLTTDYRFSCQRQVWIKACTAIGSHSSCSHTHCSGLPLLRLSSTLIESQCVSNPSPAPLNPYRPYSALLGPTLPEPAPRGPTWPILVARA